MTRDELIELAARLEHAAQVSWRWLVEGESPWDREATLRMVERFGQYAVELRDMARGT